MARYAFAALLSLSACSARTPETAHAAPSLSRSGGLVAHLAAREFDQVEASFDQTLRASAPASQLAALWDASVQRRGAYRAIEQSRQFRQHGHDVEISLLRFEHGLAELRAVYGSEGLIAGFWLRPGERSARALALANALLAGDVEAVRSHFSPALSAAIPVAPFARLVSGLHDRVGAHPSLEEIEHSSGQFDVARVHCRGQSGRLVVEFAFRRDSDRLEGLHILPDAARSSAEPDKAPPPYAVEGHYREQSALIGDPGRALPATLTLPLMAAEPFAAVLLVHGSGPQDRDETVLANRPFRDLALGLASRGIAVLRYEKRTFGPNALTLHDPTHITFDEETVDDAVTAARCLLETKGVDRSRVIVLGHSQGGMAAPRIAEREPRLRALVLLAPPARPLEDLLLDQSRTHPAALAELAPKVALVKSADLADARAEDLPLGLPASWWLSMRGYSPIERTRALAKQTLVLQGDHDLQVSQADFSLWSAALASEAWASVQLIPGLNHLFEVSADPASFAEYARPSHVDERVITQIAAFIAALPSRAAVAQAIDQPPPPAPIARKMLAR